MLCLRFGGSNGLPRDDYRGSRLINLCGDDPVANTVALPTWDCRSPIGTREAVAVSLAAEEPQYYYDYLNDMDGRKILAEVLPLASEEQRTSVEARVSSADATVRAHTEETEECIWGSESAAKHGWSPHIHWWYYRRPKVHGEGWD